MREYGFSLTHILPYKDKNLRFCPYKGEYGSVKTRILAYFMQCDIDQNFPNSERSPPLKTGVTLAIFKSSGKISFSNNK